MERLVRQLLACCVMLGLCAVLTSTAPAFGQPGEAGEAWQVLEKYGSVRYRAPGESEWSQAVSGTELPPGARVVTGRHGWIILRHAGGNFWVEPNARFVLPSPDAARVRQELGDLHYRILRAQEQRFEVETPYASLVVKGTVFDVQVADAGMAVQVARGWVEVTTPQGSRADLRKGQAARIRGAEPTLEVQPAPGQAFEPVQPDLQITPAVQPREAVPTDPETDATGAQKSWWQRVLDGLRGTLEPGTTASAASGGGGSDGSNDSASSSDGGSSSGGSSDGDGSSADGGDSGSSGSSGDSGGSTSSSGGTSGGGGSGGGISAGVGVGGVSAGVSADGGGIGASVGVGGGGLSVGIGR